MSQKGDSEESFETGSNTEVNDVRRDGRENRRNGSELNALQLLERDIWFTLIGNILCRTAALTRTQPGNYVRCV
jgi:hypothetical protein